MARPRVSVVVLGGTITMPPAAGTGIVPTVTGADLVAAVPGLLEIAEIIVETPFLKPGASLELSEIAGLLSRLSQQTLPADGVVIVQGTDTIEDTAFLADILWDRTATVVVTGAMRGAAAVGADGPANLEAAIRTASSAETRGLGALVVLNDEIHAASRVQKQHKSLPSAFCSLNGGPIGIVVEGEPRLFTAISSSRGPALQPASFPPVAAIKIGMGDDDRLLQALPGLGYKGVVLEGMGAGHVPAKLVPAIDELMTAMPVVLASRVSGGRILERTYGFPGSEIDLIGRGVIPAGWLSANKAALLLACMLGAGCDRPIISARFGMCG
jgi:L-asparaginase